MVAIAGTMHSLPECIRGKAKRRSRNLWRRRFISPCAGRHYSPPSENEPPWGTGGLGGGLGTAVGRARGLGTALGTARGGGGLAVPRAGTGAADGAVGSG